MPRQELFFEQVTGSKRVEVIKTYDSSYAREVFGSMDEEALEFLAAALEIEKNYDAADIPEANGADYEDFLWEELLAVGIEDVRLDPNMRSFFVVSEKVGEKGTDVYVSADWPSAEGFAKKLLDLPI